MAVIDMDLFPLVPCLKSQNCLLQLTAIETGNTLSIAELYRFASCMTQICKICPLTEECFEKTVFNQWHQ